MIDSHCHLNYKGLVEDQAAVVARARAAGVTGKLNISTREREWGDVFAAATATPDIWASFGIHPHEADDHPDIDTERQIEAAIQRQVLQSTKYQKHEEQYTAVLRALVISFFVVPYYQKWR